MVLTDRGRSIAVIKPIEDPDGDQGRVLKTMAFERPPDYVEGREPAPLGVPLGATVYGGALAAIVLVLGVAWNPLAEASEAGASGFAKPPPVLMKYTELPKVAVGGAGAPKGKAPAKGGEKGKGKGKGGTRQ